jgi:hypothetical protein
MALIVEQIDFWDGLILNLHNYCSCSSMSGSNKRIHHGDADYAQERIIKKNSKLCELRAAAVNLPFLFACGFPTFN